MDINYHDFIAIILGLIIVAAFIIIYGFVYSILYDVKDLKQRMKKLESLPSSKFKT